MKEVPRTTRALLVLTAAVVALATVTPAHAVPDEEKPLPVSHNPHGTPRHVKDDEVGESSGNPYSTTLMTYHGGRVQTSPRIYLVFWGSNWFTGGDPNGVAARLHSFYQGLGGSTWANVLKQYTSNFGSFTNPTGQYRGWIQDSTALPASPTQNDMAAAARRAAGRVGDYSCNAQYVIALPWGVVDAYTRSAMACGWHSWTSAGGAGNWITFTSLPYTPYLDRLYAPTGCGGGDVNGATAGVLDGVTINAAHEYAETVTDPGANGWYATNLSGEVGDKCSWVNLRNRTFANGLSFPVQPSWSNLWRQQYGYGCYY